MLMRMYMRWAEQPALRQRFSTIRTAKKRIKSVTINVIGEFAYGYMRSETGVHRLVRISPFDAASVDTLDLHQSRYIRKSTIESIS